MQLQRVSVHEDEYAAEDLQLSEVRMALCRSRPSDCQRRCETHRKNAGVELSSPAFCYYEPI